MTKSTTKQLMCGLPWIFLLFLGLAVLQPSDDLFRFVYFASIIPLTLYLCWRDRQAEQLSDSGSWPAVVFVYLCDVECA